MNRRDFIKSFATLITSIVVAPSILEAARKTSAKIILQGEYLAAKLYDAFTAAFPQFELCGCDSVHRETEFGTFIRLHWKAEHVDRYLMTALDCDGIDAEVTDIFITDVLSSIWNDARMIGIRNMPPRPQVAFV